MADVEGDGTLEVVVLSSPFASSHDLDLEVFDLRSGVSKGVQRLLPSASPPTDMQVADVEGGSEAEIFVASEHDLWMYRFGEPALWALPGVGGFSLAIGNVDSDPAQELVVSYGRLRVLEPAARAEEWSLLAYAHRALVADVDGDGRAEILSVGDLVQVIDGETRSARWSRAFLPSSDAYPARVADLDGDGRLELVLYGSRGVLLLDAETGAKTAEPGVFPWTAWSLVDLEILELPDCTTAVVGASAGELRAWSPGRHSFPSLGPTLTEVGSGVAAWLAVGRLRGDGRTRVSWSAHGSPGTLGVSDLHHALEEERLPRTLGGTAPFGPMAMAQLDGDPQLELVVPELGPTSGDFRVSVYDGLLLDREVSTSVRYGERFTSLLVSDQLAPAEMVIAATTATPSGGSGFLRLYQASTGQTIWTSPNLLAVPLDLAVGRLAGGPGPEIVVVAQGEGLLAFDASTHERTWDLQQPDATCVAFADVGGDSAPEIIVGASGSFRVYDGGTRELLFQASLGVPGAVNAVRVADTDGDGGPELVFAFGSATATGTGGLMIVRPSDGSVLWRSPELMGPAGIGGALFVGDVDDDGKTEVAVGTSGGVAVFEYDPGSTDSHPPVWRASVGVATAGPAPAESCCPAVDLTWGPADDDASPPVSYRVYRGPAGFVPSPETLRAELRGTGYRDSGVVPGSPVSYVVRAVDRAGNEDANLTARTLVPPPAPILSLVPLNPTICELETVTFHVVSTSGVPAVLRWFRDGVPVNPGAGGASFSIPGAYTALVAFGSCPAVETPPSVLTTSPLPGDYTRNCIVSLPDLFGLCWRLIDELGGPPAIDVDGNGVADLDDVDYMADYLLATGPAPR